MASAKRGKKKLTARKARKILHDGTVRGHPITPAQRRFFGAKSSGAKRKGGRRKH